MSAHAPTSRSRERPSGDEEASSVLSLGEFQGVPSLSLSEARILIGAVLDHRRMNNRDVQETETLVKTQDYLDVFARFKQKENIEAVERLLLSRPELESFERSQLGKPTMEGAITSAMLRWEAKRRHSAWTLGATTACGAHGDRSLIARLTHLLNRHIMSRISRRGKNTHPFIAEQDLG